MSNLKIELQKVVNHWNQVLKEMNKEGRNDVIFGEYKGKIYAARRIADMLGIEIETRFPWQWFDEAGKHIEPEDYDYK